MPWPRGKPISEERKAALRRPLSVEHRKNISKGLKGKPKSEAWKVKARGHHRGGWKLGADTRKKMSVARKGVPHTAEWSRKIGEAQKGKVVSEETRKKISETSRGRVVTPETRAKISVAFRGEKHPFWGKTHSEETRKKISEVQRGKRLGSENHSWKGGVTPLNKKIRGSVEYRLWREAVFKRDNFTCIWCGQRGGKLNADHIKPFALFPELRFALDNGRTLCEPCHRTTETYGNHGRRTS